MMWKHIMCLVCCGEHGDGRDSHSNARNHERKTLVENQLLKGDHETNCLDEDKKVVEGNGKNMVVLGSKTLLVYRILMYQLLKNVRDKLGLWKSHFCKVFELRSYLNSGFSDAHVFRKYEFP